MILGLLARTKARLMTECTGVTEAGTNNPFLFGKSLITLLVETEVIFIVMIDKGLFTYYVSQKQGFLHPPSPLRQQWSAFG